MQGMAMTASNEVMSFKHVPKPRDTGLFSPNLLPKLRPWHLYEVKDEHDVSHTIDRAYLRHWKRHSVASGHVTDDKVHDRHAMQHFTTNKLVYF